MDNSKIMDKIDNKMEKPDNSNIQNFLLPRGYLCLLSFCSSFPMAFSAWSEDARKLIDASAQNMSVIGLCLYWGDYVSFLPGLLYDFYGPRIAASYGVFLHVTCLIIMVATFYNKSMSIFSTALAMILIGQASCTTNCLAIFITALMGPEEERGWRCGIASFCFAIGGAFWAKVYGWVGSLGVYFIIVGTIFILVTAFMWYLDPIKTYLKNDSIDETINDSKSSCEDMHKFEKTKRFLTNRRFLMLWFYVSFNQSIIISTYCQNAGTIGKSIRYAHVHRLAVIFGLSDACSRLVMGYFRDRTGDFTIQILSLSLTLISLFMALYDIYLIEWILIFAGWGFGATWATFVPAVFEIPYARENIGIGVGCVCLSIAILVPILSLLLSYNYDHNAYTDIDREFTQCYGSKCFQATFQIFTIGAVLCAIVCILNNYFDRRDESTEVLYTRSPNSSRSLTYGTEIETARSRN